MLDQETGAVTHRFQHCPGEAHAQRSYSCGFAYQDKPMSFVDWIIVLAFALIALAFFASRSRGCRSLNERMRQLQATRLFVQAMLALWAAPLLFQQGLFARAGLPSWLNPNPRLAFAISLMLLIAGCRWLILGGRLLRQRRMFRAS
jgi:hypothetical protein